MHVFISFTLVVALGSIAFLGVQSGYQQLFGIFIPYAAVAIFVAGFILRVMDWGRSPVPYRIPTTAGQQYSDLPFIKQDVLGNPVNGPQTVLRMILEVLTFRSLFRNTSVSLQMDGTTPRVGYSSAKWLWLAAILFHYSFLTIFIRHFRFFFAETPLPIELLEFFDGILQIGAPRFYQTDLLILVGLGFLLLRRFFDSKVRYISLFTDYFPVFLILGIVGTGIWMRYVGKTDIASVKVLTMGLVTFTPVIPESVGAIFYIHLFLVSALLVYFPFSKLMHMGGVFLSPTRNLPNDSRIRLHVNPWNPPKKFHTYEAYENDFREAMIGVGLPVDKMSDDAPAEENKE